MVLSTSSSNSSMVSMTRRVLKADQFELVRELGSGSFGAVYQAIDKLTGQIVAIKKIDMENSDDDIEEIQKEISILAGCNDDRITRYYGSFVNGYKLWIIMEYLGGGSCLDLIHSTGPFNESAIAKIVVDLLKGLKYLHRNGKIHRDIKAANLLVSDLGDVKIADFGVAAQLSSNLSCRNTFVGTPFWMAPEVIGQKDYTYSADVWSLGITSIELATGKPPLSQMHPMEVLFFIPKNMPPRLDEKYSKDFRDFVALCLQKRPEDRPTVSELLKHPFLRNASIKELVNRVHEWKRIDNSRDKGTPVAATVDESSLALSEEDSWIFDTVKPTKGAAKEGPRIPTDIAPPQAVSTPVSTPTGPKPPASNPGSLTGSLSSSSSSAASTQKVAAPKLSRKLSRAGSDISLIKKGSASSMSSELSSISEISTTRIPSPVTYQNFDLTPHNPVGNETSYYDMSSFTESVGTVQTLPRDALTSDRRTHLVKVFSHAASKFNDRSLAEIADILTMEPIPSQVESYLIKKIGGGSKESRASSCGKPPEKPKSYDSVESMLLTSWFAEANKRQATI